MIDWKKTEETGYGKEYFEKYPGSGRKIFAICDKCKSGRWLKYQGYRDLCLLCIDKNRNKRIIIHCDNCGKEIEKLSSNRSDNNFCCRKCYSNWKIKKLIIHCDNCRKEIEKLPSNIKNHNFCSTNCYSEWRLEKIIVYCDNCGKEIKRSPSGVNNHNFCCNTCQGEWKSKNLVGEKNSSWKGGKIIVYCDNCGKEIERYPSQINNTHNFCCHHCHGKWEAKNCTGENNPWFGGTQTEKSRIKMSATHQRISYDEWEEFAHASPYCPDFNEECRESNREKYGRKCFLTGLSEEENIDKNEKQRHLSVHHYDMDKMQGCNGKRWKLVPLCLEWHGKAHSELWESRITWLLKNVWNTEKIT